MRDPNILFAAFRVRGADGLLPTAFCLLLPGYCLPLFPIASGLFADIAASWLMRVRTAPDSNSISDEL